MKSFTITASFFYNTEITEITERSATAAADVNKRWSLQLGKILFFCEDFNTPRFLVPRNHPSREGINPGRPLKVLLFHPLPWRGAESGGVGLVAAYGCAVSSVRSVLKWAQSNQKSVLKIPSLELLEVTPPYWISAVIHDIMNHGPEIFYYQPANSHPPDWTGRASTCSGSKGSFETVPFLLCSSAMAISYCGKYLPAAAGAKNQRKAGGTNY